jgi:PAS domain S-box-containing protein
MELGPDASRAVDRLLDAHDPLRSLLEHTTLVAAVTDEDDRVLYCNPALASRTGCSPEALIGKS